jgi:hypothetical protein
MPEGIPWVVPRQPVFKVAIQGRMVQASFHLWDWGPRGWGIGTITVLYNHLGYFHLKIELQEQMLLFPPGLFCAFWTYFFSAKKSAIKFDEVCQTSISYIQTFVSKADVFSSPSLLQNQIHVDSVTSTLLDIAKPTSMRSFSSAITG